jgi:hypothetical protein
MPNLDVFGLSKTGFSQGRDFWFFLTAGTRFWMGMMLGSFTMEWGENEATSHEVE